MTPDAPAAGDPPDAGWYPDHDGVVRWWDGTAWTERVAPARRRTTLVLRTLVALAVFVVVAGVTVVVLGMLRAPEEVALDEAGPADVVEANFAALREGDCAAYVATFSAADRAVMGESFCRQSDVFGAEGLSDLAVTSTEVDGDTARVTGTFTDAGGEQSFAFDLVREPDGWAIRQ